MSILMIAGLVISIVITTNTIYLPITGVSLKSDNFCGDKIAGIPFALSVKTKTQGILWQYPQPNFPFGCFSLSDYVAITLDLIFWFIVSISAPTLYKNLIKRYAQ